MPFEQLLSLDRILIDCPAQSKTAVFLKISQIFSQIDAQLSASSLFDAYWNRECLGSTAIGHGVLIPHIRTQITRQTFGCFIKLKHPVDFGAEDRQPIDLILGLLVPENRLNQHLDTLAALVRHFKNPSFRQACRHAEDPNALYSFLVSQSSVQTDRQLEPLT